MRENEFINIIKNTLSDFSLIGDDCAYLEDVGLFVTQDTLFENVHFSMHTTTPYLLGRKSVSVNLSDLAAAISQPAYISVSLSLPSTIKDSFISEFYRGVNDVCEEFSVKVTGGDITSGDKIVISVCAFGKRKSSVLSGRNKAKNGDAIVVTGEFGSSSAALYALSDFIYCDETLKEKHLNPVPRVKEGLILADLAERDIAATDSSDGLITALYNIAVASKHSIRIDLGEVPVNPALISFCSVNNLDVNDFVKWGGEDYELVLCIPEDLYEKLDKTLFKKIGTVLNKDSNPTVSVKKGTVSGFVTDADMEKFSYNHFKKSI